MEKQLKKYLSSKKEVANNEFDGIVRHTIRNYWWFIWIGLWTKKTTQNRGLDERYEEIAKKALANGWKVTLVAIYVFWFLLVFGVQISVAQVLELLLVVHMIGWADFTIKLNISIFLNGPRSVATANIFIKYFHKS